MTKEEQEIYGSRTKVHARRRGNRLARAGASLFFTGLSATLLVPAVAAAPGTASSPVQVSGNAPTATGNSPFAGCDISGHRLGPDDVNYLDSEVQGRVEVNPIDPNNAISVWQQDRWPSGGSRGVVAGVSRDGGATWKARTAHFGVCAGGTTDNGGGFERASFPDVTFAPNGDAYMTTSAYNLVDDKRSAILVAKSTDGGDTWSEPTQLVNEPETLDGFANFRISLTAHATHSSCCASTTDPLLPTAPRIGSVHLHCHPSRARCEVGEVFLHQPLLR